MAGYGGCAAGCDGGAGGDETAVGSSEEGLAVEYEGVGRGDGGEIVSYAVFDHLAWVGVVDDVIVDRG